MADELDRELEERIRQAREMRNAGQGSPGRGVQAEQAGQNAQAGQNVQAGQGSQAGQNGQASQNVQSGRTGRIKIVSADSQGNSGTAVGSTISQPGTGSVIPGAGGSTTTMPPNPDLTLSRKKPAGHIELKEDDSVGMQDDRKDDNDFGDMIHKPNGHHRTGFTGINIGGGNVNILAIVLTIVTIIAVIWCICNFQALSIIIAAVVAAIIIKLQRFFLIVAVILVILIIIWWSSGRGGRRYRRW